MYQRILDIAETCKYFSPTTNVADYYVSKGVSQTETHRIACRTLENNKEVGKKVVGYEGLDCINH